MEYSRTIPLQIGLKVDHRGQLYKIVDHHRQKHSVVQYVFQSLSSEQTKRVFRHEICDASVTSMFNRLTEETIFQFEHESSQSDDELSSITFTQGVPGPVVEPEPVLEPEQALEPEPVLEPEPPLKKPRFKEMPSREHIDMLTQARVEETIKQQTDWGVRLFRGWLTENQYNDKFEELESSILNDRLSFSTQACKQKKGTDYSKSALVGIRAAISRHLTSPPFNRNVNLMTDNAFMTSNHVITGMNKTLKRAGKDVTVHKKPVAEGDVQRLYSSGVFNTDSPVTLQNKVYWDLMLNFDR
ncbi:unnamed protein product [Mytilus coruscus]|uniref:Uncharacterized protein n=1 Tax=Mytilus coruscus TaxID=42192 RepID=A0A6J8DRT7_MYTCO|nr:unnamed protein product [Mytilus coruscus]